MIGQSHPTRSNVNGTIHIILLQGESFEKKNNVHAVHFEVASLFSTTAKFALFTNPERQSFTVEHNNESVFGISWFHC